MHWEKNTPSWPELHESDIPGELLDGIERLAAEGDLVKARLRWRPHLTNATGFVTRDRLLGIAGESSTDVALALASFASHLYEQGTCEPRFEAQFKRELEAEGEGPPTREWRSITFHLDAAIDEDTRVNLSRGDVPEVYEMRSGARSGRRLPAHEPSSYQIAPPTWEEHERRFALLQSNPMAYAIILLEESRARETNILRELLATTALRLDDNIASQSSNTRHLNQSLDILTRGAGKVAGIGVDLFQQGLEGQARVAKMERESEASREKTELARDAVKQGSLLLQAILMSQANKQRQPSPPPPPPPPPAAEADPASGPIPRPSPAPEPPTPPPPPSPSPSPSPKSPADQRLEESTTEMLDRIDDVLIARMAKVAPNVVRLLGELRREPTAPRIRELVKRAQAEIDRVELEAAGELLEDDTKAVLGRVFVQVLL